MKRSLTFVFITLFALYQFGCSSEDVQLNNPTNPSTVDGISAAPLADDVVLTNMYTDETENLSDKTRVQIVTVLEGTGRVAIEARFRGVRDFGFGFPLYECELLDQSIENMGGIAQGMSGSPVGPPGRVMGALAYGDFFADAPTRFWVTAIDAMEATRDRQTLGDRLVNEPAPAAPSGRISSVYAPVKTPLMVTGIQPHRVAEIESQLQGTQFQYLQIFASNGVEQEAPVEKKINLAAGDMIGVGIATGDIVNAIGFGTVTQVYDDNTFVAFGHPMNGRGKAAMPVYRAVVNGIVPNLQASYKSVSAYGDPIGTITKDFLPCIVGELGAAPEMIPVKVAYQLESDEIIEKSHKVAYGQERFIPIVAATTFDAIRQETTFGTIEGTITLQFQETENVYTEKFYAASSDPFFDTLLYTENAVTSFTNLLLNSAGKATLKDVSITIKDSPKIRLATIHEVITPDYITPGETATVSIVFLPHWTSAQNGRKIQRDVTLDVPEGWTEDKVNLRIESQYPGGPPEPFDSLFSDFSFDFDFDNEETVEELDPENLDQLIEKKNQNLVEQPGLITIVLSPSDDFSFGDDFLFDDFPLPGIDVPIDDENFELPEDLENLEIEEELPDPPSSVEAEINIDGFIVFGSKQVNIDVVEMTENVDGE